MWQEDDAVVCTCAWAVINIVLTVERTMYVDARERTKYMRAAMRSWTSVDRACTFKVNLNRFADACALACELLNECQLKTS